MEPVATARVLFADTDAMGIVYYANYLRWFEVGRVELLRGMGMAYREMTTRGIHLPVTEAAVRYLSPARYDDFLEIRAEVRELRRASVSFGYRILRAGGEVLAEGTTTHAFTDETGRVIRVPAEFRHRFLPGGNKGEEG